MGLISTLESLPRFGAVNPNDERYWSGGPVYMSTTGLPVTPQLALGVSCIFQGTRLIAETLGSLPRKFYRDRDDGGKDTAREHYLWPLLSTHGLPNEWQTAQEFVEVMVARALLWPYSFAEIKPGPDGPFGSLEPIEPEWISKIDQVRSTRRIRIEVSEPGEAPRTLVQDQLFRLKGFGTHRFLGADLLKLAREAVGVWLAMEKYGAFYFAQGGGPRTFLEYPGKMSPGARTQMRELIGAEMSGLRNMHRPLPLEEGVKVHSVPSHTAKESQMTEAREGQVHELARWIGIPVAFLMGTETQSYASAVERGRHLIDIALRPWGVRFENCVGRDLVVGQQVYMEFLFDALLRGDTPERFAAYALGIQNGFMSENEVRLRENLNPRPGLDEPRRSVNQDRGEEPRQKSAPPARRKAPPPDDDDEAEAATLAPPVATSHHRLLATSSAQRIVRRELSAVTAKAERLAADQGAWSAWLGRFYGEHRALVSEGMQLAPALAEAYCDAHQEALEADGLAAAERWETSAVAELVALAVPGLTQAVHLGREGVAR